MKGMESDHGREKRRRESSIPHTCLHRVQAVKVWAIRPSGDSWDHGESLGDCCFRGFANFASGVTGAIGAVRP